MAGSLAPSGGVLYVDGTVTVDPTDCGVILDGLNTRTGRLTVATLDPGVLFRMAGCLMVAADTLTTKLAANASTADGVAVSR